MPGISKGYFILGVELHLFISDAFIFIRTEYISYTHFIGELIMTHFYFLR